jgi:hypothetical protein
LYFIIFEPFAWGGTREETFPLDDPCTFIIEYELNQEEARIAGRSNE